MTIPPDDGIPMLDEAPDTGQPDGIVEGKRLIRLGGDHGLSLVDRLAERFHALTWRTPIHSIRLKGRFPLKLIAVPEDPLLGDVARGHALLDGRMTFLGESHAVDSLDMLRAGFGTAFTDYLQSFAWLRDLSTVATRAQGSPVAEALTSRWMSAHAEKPDAIGWRPDLWGRRILYWTFHAPLILSSSDTIYRSRVLNALATGARHIDRFADKAPPGAGRIAAWCGVVTAGLLLPGGDPRRAFGEAGLARALGTSLFDDGGSVSRSPAALLDSIELLAMLCAVYDARGEQPSASVRAALARMVPALLGVTHADRALASWQGGGPIAADRVAAVIAASGVRTRPLRQSRDWGYQRLAAGSTVLIADAAPPPVAQMVEGGCASTLAFEFSDGPARIVVNCGGAKAAVSQLPVAFAEGLRTTAAHSTLTIGDSNSTAILPGGMLGRGVGEVELSRQENDVASRIEMSHDGYVRRWGFLHRRQLVLTGDGRELRGEDMLLPRGRKRKGDATPFTVRFHLGAGVQAAATADSQGAILRLPGGAMWQFRCRGGLMAVEDSLWIDGAGMPMATQQLVVSGQAAAGGANIGWAFKRAV